VRVKQYFPADIHNQNSKTNGKNGLTQPT